MKLCHIPNEYRAKSKGIVKPVNVHFEIEHQGTVYDSELVRNLEQA